MVLARVVCANHMVSKDALAAGGEGKGPVLSATSWNQSDDILFGNHRGSLGGWEKKKEKEEFWVVNPVFLFAGGFLCFVLTVNRLRV